MQTTLVLLPAAKKRCPAPRQPLGWSPSSRCLASCAITTYMATFGRAAKHVPRPRLRRSWSSLLSTASGCRGSLIRLPSRESHAILGCSWPRSTGGKR